MAKKSIGALMAAERWKKTTASQRSAVGSDLAAARWADKPPVGCKRCGKLYVSIRAAAKCPCPRRGRGRPANA